MGINTTALRVTLSGRTILDCIDIAIGAGELVGLIGPNGAGKTTLLRATAGLLPYEGGISVDGHEIRLLKPNQRARLIGYLPQSHEVAWPLSVEDLVTLGRAPHRSPYGPLRDDDRAAIARALADMDLEALKARSVKTLSGGELARVLIARVLAQDTAVLLADEPTAGLDPSHQIATMTTLKRLALAGRSVIVSLHDLSLSAQWCDRLILLDPDGKVSASGEPTSVLTHERLADVYGIEAMLDEKDGIPFVVPTGLVAPRPLPRG